MWNRFFEFGKGCLKGLLIPAALIALVAMVVPNIGPGGGDGTMILLAIFWSPILGVFSFVIIPVVVAATYFWTRRRADQRAGAVASYAVLILAFLWLQIPSQIEFQRSPKWNDDGIKTVAMWDGASYDSTAARALAPFLVEQFVYLEKEATFAQPKVKQAFVRRSGSDCDIHDPNVEFGMMQYHGRFGSCIVENHVETDLRDAIFIKMTPRSQRGWFQPAAIAYKMTDGTSPIEVARWKVTKYPFNLSARKYYDETDYVFDLAGPSTNQEFERQKFTMGQWVDLAYEWIDRTRINPGLLETVKRASRWTDDPYSPFLKWKADLSKFPPPKYALSAAEQEKFTAIATAACRWRLDEAENRYVQADPLPTCKQTYEEFSR